MTSGLFSDDHKQVEYDENEQFAATISKAAVLSLILGLMSLATLISMMFVVIPVVAVLLGLVGLLQSSSKRENPSGGRLCAILGLTLALFFGGWNLTMNLARTANLRSLARERAVEWLDIVQKGELRRADQLRFYPSRQAPPTSELKNYYENNRDTQRRMEEFFDKSPFTEIRESNGGLEFQHVGSSPTYIKGREEFIPVLYEFSFTNNEGEQDRLRFGITMARFFDREDETRESFWRVESVVVK